MSRDSVIRKLKRQAMKRAGLKFSDRLTEWVRTGKPAADVTFEWDGEKHPDGPRLVAKKK